MSSWRRLKWTGTAVEVDEDGGGIEGGSGGGIEGGSGSAD
jgi:hypothetical protein